MKKNNIITFIYALVIGTSFTSCTDWLDLKPEGSVVLDEFWQNKSQVEGVLATCYKSFTTEDASTRMLLWGEIRSDNVQDGRSHDNTDVKKMLEVDVDAENWICDWGSMYSVINYCNTFLYYAPTVPAIDPNFSMEECNTMMGEVKALRALAYFYLVRTFKEVPYGTDPSISDNQEYNREKSSEEFLIGKIIEDLESAERLVRNKFETTRYNKGRIIKSSVRAMLADVYLWTNNYDKCVNYCDLVMADTTYTLTKNDVSSSVYNRIYGSGNSTESIFELQYSSDNWNNATKNYYGTSGAAKDQNGMFYAPKYLIDKEQGYSPFNFAISTRLKESEKDIRLSYSIYSPLEESAASPIFKYAGSNWSQNSTGRSSYIYRSSTSNWIVYRLSDIMLMKAESLVQKAKLLEQASVDGEEEDSRIQIYLTDALELVNKTYVRANGEMSALLKATYPTVNLMESLVLRERHRELLFEGKRWFDLMRLARRGNDGEGDPSLLIKFLVPKFTKDETLQTSRMSVMNALYLPVPQSEINVNKLITQNPFYKSNGGNTSIN